MHSIEESADAYLQQIQPRNLADLIAHVQHDLLMLVGSYISYRDLFEQQIPTLDLLFNLQSDIDEIFTIISKATQGLKSAINALPDFSALSIIDVQLASERRHLVAYDLISGSGNLLECSRLLQHLLD